MKKFVGVVLSLLFSLSAYTKSSTLDDSMSEQLSPLLSNYIGDYQVVISAKHVFFVAGDILSTNPILLSAITDLKGESLQDCEENSSSLVCKLASAIENFIQVNGIKKGKVLLDITLFKKNEIKKEIKDIKVLSF